MGLDHFERSEQIERTRIQTIFDNYLSVHNCSSLLLSPIGSKEKFDAVFFRLLLKPFTNLSFANTNADA